SYFEKALKLKANSADIYYGLGVAYYYLSKFSEARQYFQKAKKIFQDQKNYKAVQEIEGYLKYIPQ
ncbi:MAG: tetratricopeptide repeat protein, partial [Candidatus Omnitrophota bacterium]